MRAHGENSTFPSRPEERTSSQDTGAAQPLCNVTGKHPSSGEKENEIIKTGTPPVSEDSIYSQNEEVMSKPQAQQPHFIRSLTTLPTPDPILALDIIRDTLEFQRLAKKNAIPQSPEPQTASIAVGPDTEQPVKTLEVGTYKPFVLPKDKHFLFPEQPMSTERKYTTSIGTHTHVDAVFKKEVSNQRALRKLNTVAGSQIAAFKRTPHPPHGYKTRIQPPNEQPTNKQNTSLLTKLPNRSEELTQKLNNYVGDKLAYQTPQLRQHLRGKEILSQSTYTFRFLKPYIDEGITLLMKCRNPQEGIDIKPENIPHSMQEQLRCWEKILVDKATACQKPHPTKEEKANFAIKQIMEISKDLDKSHVYELHHPVFKNALHKIFTTLYSTPQEAKSR